MRGTKKWSERKDVFNLHLQRGLRKFHKRLILAPCTKTEASTKSQLNRNHWCFSCVLSGNNLPAWSRTTSLELPKWRQNDRRRRRHQLSDGRVSDLNDLHADYSKFSNNCVFCPEIKGTRHNCLGILKTKCTNGTAEQTTFIPQKTVLKNLQVHVTYFWVSFLRRKDEKFGFYRCSWLLLSENLFTCFSSHLIQLEWFLTISHDRLPSSGVTKF